MKSFKILAAFAATALWATTALGAEQIKLPSGDHANPQVISAVDHGGATITNVGWARRAVRNGWYGGYAPYYSYRPYYSGYATPYYGGYYTRPYYGYSYYGPGWSGGWYGGPRVGLGFGPMGVPGRIWW